MKFNHDKNMVIAKAKTHGWTHTYYDEGQNCVICYMDEYRLKFWLKKGTVAFYIPTEPEFFKRNVDMDEIEEILISPPYEPNPHNGHY